MRRDQNLALAELAQMSTAGRTHFYTPCWWIASVLIGTLAEVIGGGTLIKNYPYLPPHENELSYYFGLLVTLFLVIPFGILLFVQLFSTKIIVSPQGIEYHTIRYVLWPNWSDLMNVGAVSFGYASSSIALVSLHPQIRMHRWAKSLPWRWQPTVAENQIPIIPISWFGGFFGRRLRSDIRKFAPHLNV